MMFAFVFAILSLLTLAQCGRPANCDNQHAMLYTARLFNNEPITSPNYPSPYGSIGGVCQWLIESAYLDDRSYILKVVFNDFELEEKTYSCLHVHNLQFYDGPSTASDHLGSYCGTSHPDVIYTTGPYLLVRFEALRSFRGFSFNVSLVKREEAAAICRLPNWNENVTNVVGSSGSFFSPGYPASYVSGALCIWTITVPVGKIVKLTFEDFSITMEESSSDCNFVEIRDSLLPNGPVLARSSCDTETAYLPVAVYSTGRYMWVKFHSYYSFYSRREEDRGFKAHFEAFDPVVDKELCLPGNPYNNLLSFNAGKGTLMTPMRYYPPSLNCTWRITVPKEHSVYLMITKFELYRIDNCVDYVELFDGLSLSDRRITKLCGYNSPPDVVQSSGQHMTVRFVSDEVFYGRFEGFEASFIAAREKPGAVDDSDNGVSPWKIVIITVVLGAISVVFCIVCIAKRRRRSENNAPNNINEASVPMTTASDYTEPPSSPPGYPYPPDSPPPYPEPIGGTEMTPQYPPPGESYPWIQHIKTSSTASA